jgi:dsRNA-specific ribonuclease
MSLTFEELESLPTEELKILNETISRILSRRAGKTPITELKEWCEKNPPVKYSFTTSKDAIQLELHHPNGEIYSEEIQRSHYYPKDKFLENILAKREEGIPLTDLEKQYKTTIKKLTHQRSQSLKQKLAASILKQL